MKKKKCRIEGVPLKWSHRRRPCLTAQPQGFLFQIIGVRHGDSVVAHWQTRLPSSRLLQRNLVAAHGGGSICMGLHLSHPAIAFTVSYGR